MRIINTRDKRLVGTVQIGSQSIFVDIHSGEGVADVLEAMSGIIYKIASMTSYIHGSLEDAKQEVCLMILEAIPLYDKTRGAALSTFLYTYAHNKSIDMIRKHKENYADLIQYSNPIAEYKIELEERTKGWDEFCKDIMYRIFVDDELIKDVAEDVNMTPWGLTRFIRRKLAEARNA